MDSSSPCSTGDKPASLDLLHLNSKHHFEEQVMKVTLKIGKENLSEKLFLSQFVGM